jgi:hypothetical protein
MDQPSSSPHRLRTWSGVPSARYRRRCSTSSTLLQRQVLTAAWRRGYAGLCGCSSELELEAILPMRWCPSRACSPPRLPLQAGREATITAAATYYSVDASREVVGVSAGGLRRRRGGAGEDDSRRIRGRIRSLKCGHLKRLIRGNIGSMVQIILSLYCTGRSNDLNLTLELPARREYFFSNVSSYG